MANTYGMENVCHCGRDYADHDRYGCIRVHCSCPVPPPTKKNGK